MADNETRLSYDDIKAAIIAAPTTWLPGILSIVVEQAARKAVFVPGGIEKFIGNVLQRLAK